MIEATIGISLVINYILREHLGIISGGFVVPAYLALYLDKPATIAGTFFVAILAYLTLQLLGNVMFVYGRRTLMLALMLGFSYNYLFLEVFLHTRNGTMFQGYDIGVIGNIVPGIIAYWMEEQGLVQTLCVTLVNAILTCLIIMLIFGRFFAL